MSPAYDLLAVRLLISKKDDPEELALTLNGKKSNFKRADFVTFGRTLGIPAKVVERVLEKQIQSKQTMFDWINRSFLTLDRQATFRALVEENLSVLAL
jgi:serine/threonine-protein kinase HipA